MGGNLFDIVLYHDFRTALQPPPLTGCLPAVLQSDPNTCAFDPAVPSGNGPCRVRAYYQGKLSGQG